MEIKSIIPRVEMNLKYFVNLIESYPSNNEKPKKSNTLTICGKCAKKFNYGEQE